MNPFLEFQERKPEIRTDIVEALEALGDRAIAAYASVGLHHNTLSSLVPSIMDKGLVPDSSESAPDTEDIDFASELFEEKGFYYPDSARIFDIYIRGQRGNREPGVFFYPLVEGDDRLNSIYGVPERIHILAMEMGFVMLQEEGPYGISERQQARKIFEKYRNIIQGDQDAHIAVLKANPFSPNIVNQRLGNLASIDCDPKDIVLGLGILGTTEFEGIYIADCVPPEDLVVLDTRLPLYTNLDEAKLDPSRSRFFYTPPGLKRV